MTVHEVATDPRRNLVYVSHYALGMRVLSYTDSGVTEVGRFVEAGGSNYWGVEVHEMNGTTYILGSDRDRGLRIFTLRRLSPSAAHACSEGPAMGRPLAVQRSSRSKNAVTRAS